MAVSATKQSCASSGADERVRGEPIAAVAGARFAEATVLVVKPDDRYPGRRPPGNDIRRSIEMPPLR
jgi:hypothetical protein